MKYTEEQKEKIRLEKIPRFRCVSQDYSQISVITNEQQIQIQNMIDNHYPIPERYFVIESKLNTMKL